VRVGHRQALKSKAPSALLTGLFYFPSLFVLLFSL
jgi:hypothetical protein